MNLDGIDKRLLNLVQAEFPLTSQPYDDLALRLGIDRDEVIRRIEQLKVKGIIRQISPVLDSRRLGYQTTLVAIRMNEDKLERAERLIVEHPGVSHGYERNHEFNVWITLATPPEASIEAELQKLDSLIEADVIFSLPAVKMFKIGAYFDMGGDGEVSTSIGVQTSGELPQKAALSRTDRLVISELQRDLPLIPAPFSDMAERLDMDVEDFLAHCQSLRRRGVMRRFGAAVNHRRAGFKANAMACWAVPSDTVNIAGQKLAAFREVSHCYERKTNPLWQYNLFAMIHGHSREICQEIADTVSRNTGLTEYVLLYSTKEFKKTRIKYLV